VLAGPTAAGKTAVSLRLATRARCEVVSADARQIYRGMDIGTAKPTAAERAAVMHHCIDIRTPGESYNASEYASDARAAIDRVAENALPVIVGGSGLYITAALDGLSTEGAGIDPAIRDAIKDEFAERGRDAMYDALVRVDPVAAARYADRNPRRIERALAYVRMTGRPFSSTWDAPRDAAPYEVVRIGITQERSALNARIEERCRAMWTGGLLDETRALVEAGVDPLAQAMQTVGYAEAYAVISGRMNESDALQAMIVSTRRYAKRQMTWFQKDERWEWISGSVESMTDMTVSILERRGWWKDFVLLPSSNEGKSV
jgi:tRNA dimethylallyltransferase